MKKKKQSATKDKKKEWGHKSPLPTDPRYRAGSHPLGPSVGAKTQLREHQATVTVTTLTKPAHSLT